MRIESLLVLPLVIPLVTAMACLLFWTRPFVRRVVSVTGSTALFFVTLSIFLHIREAGFATVGLGGWNPPMGIALVADRLSALMLLVVGTVAILLSLYQVGFSERVSGLGGASVIFQILLMGVSGAFLAGDLFNLYVWFEVMLIASFVLMAWGGGPIRLVGSLKYVTLNLTASAIFLAAVGLVYAQFGTLNLADLARIQMELDGANDRGRLLALLFLACFGIKSAIFPFFFWLPDSYPNVSAATGALFAALLTKVGVYALLRIFTLVFPAEVEHLRIVLLVIAGATMVLGVFGAMAQEEIRRILSFHIISQIGYMIMGLALFTPLALAATIYFVIHNIVAKTNLFLVGGIVEDVAGSSELSQVRGLFNTHGLLGSLFLVSSLSLAGIPPLAGFWAKVALIVAGFRVEQPVIVGVAVFVSLLTLFSMMKIWTRIFWGKAVEEEEGTAELRPEISRAKRILRYTPVVGFALLAIALGLLAQPMLDYTLAAADQLANPSRYVEAVLGEQP